MSLLTDLAERLRSLLFRARDEREMDEELDFHLEMEATRLRGEGLDPGEARRRATMDFGGRARIQEEVRDARGTRWLDQVRKDVGYAVRSLRQHRGFALVTVLILGLGIGANTATFTLVNALLLRPLPVHEPDRLVTIGNPSRTGSLAQGTPSAELLSYPVYDDVRRGTRTLSGVYATGRTARFDLRTGSATGARNEGDHPLGRFVSANFFSLLGVPAFLGRTFSESEDRAPGSGPVVVLSHAYWARRFGADPKAVGSVLTLNGTPLTVIGVTPPGFTGDLVGQARDLWIPVTMEPVLMPHREWLQDREVSWLLLMGRLKPGVTVAQARSELTELVTRSLIDHATADNLAGIKRGLAEDGVPVGPGALGFSYYREALAPTLALLMAAVALVLLVVAANVANLMLARGAARTREMSIRLSLGAARRRVVQQLLTECLVLAVAGGGLGLLLARIGSGVLLRLAGQGEPLPLAVPLDGRVLAFTAGLSLLAVALFGVVPALRTTQVEIASALRASGRSLTGGSGRLRLNRLLVVAQVALSTLLLVGTGMIVRSLTRLTDADLGLDRDRLVVAEVDAIPAGYEGERLASLRRDLIERIGRVAGVDRATFSENGLFSGTESGSSVDVSGYRAADAEARSVAYDDVGPSYFTTIGARLLRGRDFGEGDGESGPLVAVINDAMARFYFTDRDPIGQTVTMSRRVYAIVGVVADVKGRQVRGEAERRLYVPMAQVDVAPGRFKIEVRTAGDPARLVEPVRRALEAADPGLVVTDVSALRSLVRESLSQDRMATQVITSFGALALFLAALGLYGVMAYATVRRSGEFGLRMALGAQQADVTRLVIGEALTLVTIGAVVGVPAALGAAKLFQSQWFGIGAVDPPAIGLALAALLMSGLLAAYLPALRASRIPPLEALRAD